MRYRTIVKRRIENLRFQSEFMHSGGKFLTPE